MKKRIAESLFYDLLSLKLSGDATPEQLILLQEQLTLNPEWQFLHDQILQYPKTNQDETELAELAYVVHATKMRIEGHQPFKQHSDTTTFKDSSKTNNAFHYIKYAAAIAACLITFFLVRTVVQRNHQNTTVNNEVTTKKGSKSNIKLPDGTLVWLNADSKLTYAVDFAHNREVVMVGEAFFDVTHDAEHPFVIHSGNASIKVLGTAFNVRNYPSEKNFQTTLLRGKVEVSFSNRIGEKIILQPLEKLTVQKEETGGNPKEMLKNLVELSKVQYADVDSTITETSWVNDKMAFINEPLENIAKELENHFGVRIVFKNDSVKKYRYTGVFGNVSLENVLMVIQLSKKINYKKEGNVITIY